MSKEVLLVEQNARAGLRLGAGRISTLRGAFHPAAGIAAGLAETIASELQRGQGTRAGTRQGRGR